MTLLRRFALAALVIFFVASTTSSLWSQAQPPETRTGYWRGQHITYQWFPGKNGTGQAIYQGDILLENVTDSPNNGPHTYAQGIAFNQYFWPKVGGVAQVPYTIDPTSGDVANINTAITNFNSIFTGVIQFVPHNGRNQLRRLQTRSEQQQWGMRGHGRRCWDRRTICYRCGWYLYAMYGCDHRTRDGTHRWPLARAGARRPQHLYQRQLQRGDQGIARKLRSSVRYGRHSGPDAF